MVNAGTLNRGHSTPGMVSLGGVNSLGRRAGRTLAVVGSAAAGTGDGSGGVLAAPGNGRFQSMGVPQRSHQMLMPTLGWRQAGQATGVPIAFALEPSFKMDGLLGPAAASIS